MAGRFDSNPYEEEEVNPFAVSFTYSLVFMLCCSSASELNLTGNLIKSLLKF